MVEKTDVINYLQPRFYEKLRYSFPYLNKIHIIHEVNSADELTIFFGN